MFFLQVFIEAQFSSIFIVVDFTLNSILSNSSLYVLRSASSYFHFKILFYFLSFIYHFPAIIYHTNQLSVTTLQR